MLSFYLTTVLIWFIIIFASVKITMPLIKKNGWVEKGFIKVILGCLLIAFVPIIRFLFVFGLFILAFKEKENNK